MQTVANCGFHYPEDIDRHHRAKHALRDMRNAASSTAVFEEKNGVHNGPTAESGSHNTPIHHEMNPTISYKLPPSSLRRLIDVLFAS